MCQPQGVRSQGNHPVALTDGSLPLSYGGRVKWIEVRSREWATQYHSEQPWAAISIATESNTWPQIQTHNRLGLLQLAFLDVCNPDTLLHSILPGKIFDRSHARQILDFANLYWPRASSFLIHCEAGLSRSPAVAAALLYIHYGRGSDAWYFNTKTPNMLVYRTILKEYYDPGRTML